MPLARRGWRSFGFAPCGLGAPGLAMGGVLRCRGPAAVAMVGWPAGGA